MHASEILSARRFPLGRALLAACLAAPLATVATADAADFELGEAYTIEDEAGMWWARALGDVSGDGLLDLVVQDENAHGGWLGWYEATDGGKSWKRHIIAETGPEGGKFASGDLAVADFDGDGDLDTLAIVHPGEWGSAGEDSTIYWYENVDSGQSWKPHRIGETSAFIKDVEIADFNGDGKPDLAAVTYGGHNVLVFQQNGPDDWAKVQDIRLQNLHEGMDVGDVDGDGDIDICPNGYWIENPGGDLAENTWVARIIDHKWLDEGKPDNHNFRLNATKIFCADINNDGKDEVFISDSENDGTVSWYESDDPQAGVWTEHVIIDNLYAGHTLQVADLDRDGDLDVFTGQNGGQMDNPKVLAVFNQGDGLEWKQQMIDRTGTYNSLLGDLEGDGDPDIFRLPGHQADRYEVIVNETAAPAADASWQRHHIADLDGRAMFVRTADLDGDGDLDVAAGKWWWENPGSISGDWVRHTIGEPLNNVALLHDLDGDGDVDIFGTQGEGASKNHQLAWAQNNGSGEFQVRTNIQTGGDGDFLQGCAAVPTDARLMIALSWHNGGGGIQAVKVPQRRPHRDEWPFVTLTEQTEAEDLTAGDIDGDGDTDLLTGLHWLENAGGDWIWRELSHIGDLDEDAMPDRNDLADVNQDGRPDAIVGLELGTHVLWFENPVDPSEG
ncbi:MAG: FG-GAP repeat domain-containing protein [Phycisphaeraceae bacterium]